MIHLRVCICVYVYAYVCTCVYTSHVGKNIFYYKKYVQLFCLLDASILSTLSTLSTLYILYILSFLFLSTLSNHTIDNRIVFASDSQYIVLTVTKEADDGVGEENLGEFGGLGLQGS